MERSKYHGGESGEGRERERERMRLKAQDKWRD